MYMKFVGTGSCLPTRIVTNKELTAGLDTSDEWIISRTGIRQRHIVSEETAVSMAIEAGRKAVEDAGISPGSLDGILVATLSSEQCLPCVACEVQAALGAKQAVCFDINVACAGFITACQIAAAQMISGFMRTVLVIGSESLSHLVDWNDRGTAVLFGDGAGAAVVTCEDGEKLKFPYALHADGTKGPVLSCGWKEHDYIRMDGREIYRFAVKQVPLVIEEILEKCGRSREEIDYFILHQANERIVTAIAKKMNLGIEHFPMNIMHCGNMSSACIPVLLDEMKKHGRLKPGMKVIIAGFGAGLSWGGFYTEI